jgi:LuxR family maltose regulon positive regulatory protein
VRPGAIDRPRLHRQLDDSAAQPLTLVVAPAGWGKTTLLSAWARQPTHAERVAWLSIDEADDEPVRFWTYLLAALGTVAPDLTEKASSALLGPGLDPISLTVDALLNAAMDSSGAYVLVLDDYHLLTDPAIRESVEFLLSYLPASLRLVIAARADPRLPLARMRARGELSELRVDELRCTSNEAVALIQGVSDVAADSARMVADRSEGWPAGLQLAALTLQRAADPTSVAARISGGDRHLLDYFSSEVLVDLTPDQRDLLVRASVLERLSGPLCDAVLQRTGTAIVLDELARAELFLTPLDNQWYRCHRLFRDVLRRELDATDTPASALLRRASDWFLTQDRVDEAISHRISAGDLESALGLLHDHTRWFLDHAAMRTLLRLADELPDARTDPQLCLDLALAAGLSGQPRRSLPWLAAAEAHIAGASEPAPGWRTLRAYADFIWAVYGTTGDVDAALEHARRAVALETDPTLWGHVLTLTCLGGELLGAGRVAEASTVLQQAWTVPVRGTLPPFFLLQTAGLLALALLETGEVDHAREVIAEVREAALRAERDWSTGAAAALAMLRLAEGRMIAELDPQSALATLESAVDLAEDWGQTSVLVGALTSLTVTRWATGDTAGARLSLDRAHDASATDTTQPMVVEQLAALDARIGRDAVRQARVRRQLAEGLTDRELTILRALRGPLSAREIGIELHLSVNTVKGYTKSLYRKLGAASRAQAVSHGHDLGLI